MNWRAQKRGRIHHKNENGFSNLSSFFFSNRLESSVYPSGADKQQKRDSLKKKKEITRETKNKIPPPSRKLIWNCRSYRRSPWGSLFKKTTTSSFLIFYTQQRLTGAGRLLSISRCGLCVRQSPRETDEQRSFRIMGPATYITHTHKQRESLICVSLNAKNQ